ncbi:MAG: bifunctional DNA-formamidopyrimidine glycosylase/DNA-(apurinic or apyrimidinic site) lyase [bacterium]
MPELPEVEIIKRGLKNKIIGRKIDDIDVKKPKIFRGDRSKVIGSKISKIIRHAKMIEIDFANGKALLIHLKMTGQLVFQGKVKSEKPARRRSASADAGGGKIDEVRGGHPDKNYLGKLPNKFTHVIFRFKDGSVLYFNDLRKFGYIKIFDQKELGESKELKNLGPDPFTKGLNEEYLMHIASKRPRAKIKQILMDQTVISGIGNIYADESLFCAGISPLRQARDVSRTEFSKLIGCIKKVLKKGLEYGGSSENTFVNVEGKQGKMQEHFQIYRKTGQNCPRGCGKVKRIVVGGRGTHFCPVCQH